MEKINYGDVFADFIECFDEKSHVLMSCYAWVKVYEWKLKFLGGLQGYWIRITF